MLDGKYCKIINRFTKKIIVSGKIINHKDVPVKCITFDNKYFFTLSKHLFYKVIFSEYENEIKFDSSKYKVKLWRNVREIFPSLIYREFDITELDEEIKELVYTLNNLGLRTTGSCSGHYEENAWVDISFKSFNEIHLLIDILNNEDFNSKFVLTTGDNLTNFNTDFIEMQLRTKRIGKKAYEDINKLVEYMKIIIENKN